MSRPELSIVIVNFYSVAYTIACVRTIYSQTLRVQFEVIVVDNASYDGCDVLLAERYPDVVFVQSGTNLGFARGNNLGRAYAHGRTVLFLNPDTEVCNRGLERLYDRFQTLDAPGVVGCRLLNSDGSLQTCCVQPFPTILNQALDAEIMQRWFPSVGIWLSAKTFDNETNPVQVEAVSGACMMISGDVFDRIGGFSTDYFMYTEDLDICYKARSEGRKNYYVPDAVVVHHGGKSTQHSPSNFATVMMRESVCRFMRKFRGAGYGVAYRTALGCAALIRLAMLLVIAPVYYGHARYGIWRSSFRKWGWILRWALGREAWTRKYDRVAST